MPEPCKFPSLDSCQKRFLWTHEEADRAPHPVVGLVALYIKRCSSSSSSSRRRRRRRQRRRRRSKSAGLVIERLRVRIPAGAAGEFSSPESSLCADSYSISVPTPVLPQWHVKDPGHSANCAGGRLHLNMLIPLTQRSRSGLTMPLSRHSVGTYQETSSHATRH